jgi:putative transposase
MPRIARVVLPGHPHHIVQRGHNRQTVFAHEDDFARYLDDLRELKSVFDVKVFAFCLMTNHVHLLLAPSCAEGLGKLMKTLAARMTRYRNKLEGRSGTLWESRYKSSVVQSDGYLLACSRYIELNPVRAGMVDRVEDYRWSSFGLRFTDNVQDDWLDVHSCYESLGLTQPGRQQAYRAFFDAPVADGELRLIRDALQRGQLTGGRRFAEDVERVLGRRVECRGRGRPAVDWGCLSRDGLDRG